MENNFNTNVGTSLETSHTLDFSDRLYKVAIAFISVAGVVGAGWVFSQFAAIPSNMPHEVTVSGQGKAYVKPDIAQVSFGVTTQELKSQDAVNKNNEKMKAIITAIKDQGVQDKDIQTTLYNLTPIYDYPRIYAPSAKPGSSGSVEPSIAPVSGGQVFSGYRLEQQISVKIRNFDNINAILDKATASGATNAGSLQFTVDDIEKVQAEARQKAIAAAKEKFKNMVSQAGLRGGKLVNISEGYNSYPMPMYATGVAMDKTAETVAPEIQTGQQEITSSVNLTYQVK